MTERIAPPTPETPPRKRWTRTECELFDAMGAWQDYHLELIEGELIDKQMGKSRPHITAIVLLHQWLVGVFGFLHVQQEGPIDVAVDDNPSNEPEPDLVVLREPVTRFKKGNPGPADIVLVIEVSDLTLSFDFNKKAPLYARAGLPEYWILDMNLRRLIVHREPRDGKYHDVKSYAEQESVAPIGAPTSEFRVSKAFPD